MTGSFRKPPGDVVLSNFPKIYDSPDIIEEFVKIWCDETVSNLEKNKKQFDIDEIVEKTKKRIPLERVGNAWHLDAWVRVPVEQDDDWKKVGPNGKVDKTSGFIRQSVSP